MNIDIISIIKITPIPIGTYAVVKLRIDSNQIDKIESLVLNKRNWKEFRVYKRLFNAIKAKNRLTTSNWSNFYEKNGILNYN